MEKNEGSLTTFFEDYMKKESIFINKKAFGIIPSQFFNTLSAQFIWALFFGRKICTIIAQHTVKLQK